jgi:putative MATE family efflux protein
MFKQLLCLEDKAFYRRIRMIALPIALQNLIQFAVSMMDTLMVGRLGEIQLSASAIANQMSFMFMILSFGVANGCAVLSAQHWGKGNIAQVKQVMAFMLRVVLGLGVVFAAVAMSAPGWVMRLFIEDAQVVSEGADYLRILGVSYLYSGFTIGLISFLRSVGTVRISVFVYLVSLFVNTGLNYVLIFGHLGFPAMGIRGAAIATLIARLVELGIVLVFLFRLENKLRVRAADLNHTHPAIVRDALRYASPVLFNEMLWTSANMFIASVLGHMGREVVAANSICSILFQFTQVAVFGLSSSASTIIGNTIGEGNYAAAQRRARAFSGLSALFGAAACVLMFFSRYGLIEFYRLSDLARSYAYQMSAAASALAILQSVSIVLMMGCCERVAIRGLSWWRTFFSFGLCCPAGRNRGACLEAAGRPGVFDFKE